MDLKQMEEVIVKLLEQQSLVLYSLKVKHEFGEKILEVIVDGNDLSSDHLGVVNQKLSLALDAVGFDPNYYLEVSSPGAERPLRNETEVLSAVGKYVHIESNEINSDGYLLEFKEGILLFQINLKGRLKKIEIPYQSVKSIRLAIKF
ncbi:hypothetical protein N7603_02700 [Acholeplasma vituli]|uniref:Ribosome maturation factor RimP n=1 Tax=Paracholeplasma vituli TaxID=69473 RepID=A0ABT2PUD8_9MOLU|nr:hypothetical protein [Paracholeplasma vituli]MCU0104559.1 hypothetical protein [Paracholeplasma vituli]